MKVGDKVIVKREYAHPEGEILSFLGMGPRGTYEVYMSHYQTTIYASPNELEIAQD